MGIMRDRSQFFDTQEVLEIVGIQPIYLNKFIEREQYGIGASVRKGEGRGSRRLFSPDDVFGIALVWWLFEGGLRSKAIELVLNYVCGRKRESKASDAARIILHRDADVLAVAREPRISVDPNPKHPEQRIHHVSSSEITHLIREDATACLLIIPVKKLFAALKQSMQEAAERR